MGRLTDFYNALPSSRRGQLSEFNDAASAAINTVEAAPSEPAPLACDRLPADQSALSIAPIAASVAERAETGR